MCRNNHFHSAVTIAANIQTTKSYLIHYDFRLKTKNTPGSAVAVVIGGGGHCCRENLSPYICQLCIVVDTAWICCMPGWMLSGSG